MQEILGKACRLRSSKEGKKESRRARRVFNNRG
jgi:hypothetical protein